MSTGLTWVTLETSVVNGVWTSVTQFSDYNEAFDYAKWITIHESFTTLRVYIYTSSPNLNGIMNNGDFSPLA